MENFSIVAGAVFMTAFAAHGGELASKPASPAKPHVVQDKNRRSVPVLKSLSLSGLSELEGYGGLYTPPVTTPDGYAFAPNLGRNLSTAALSLLFSGIAAKSAGNDHGIVLRFNNNNQGLIMSADGVAGQIPLITNGQPGKANLGLNFSSDKLSGFGLGVQMEWHW